MLKLRILFVKMLVLKLTLIKFPSRHRKPETTEETTIATQKRHQLKMTITLENH